MQKIFIFILLLLSTTDITAQGKWVAEELVDPYTKDSTQYVLDQLNYLNVEETDTLNAICNELNHAHNLETAIVLLDDIDDDSFDFGVDLYNHWGLGRDDRGILLLIVMEQHIWQFISGYGAEGDYPDLLLSHIGHQKIEPQFREKRYYEGLRDAFIELTKVASDSTYKAKNYSMNLLAASDEETHGEYHEDDDDIEMEWFERLIVCWLIGLVWIGLPICAKQHSAKSMKAIKGEIKREQLTPNYGSLTYINTEKDMSWSVWSSHGFLQFLLIDMGFLIAICISALDDDIWYAIGGLLVFATYATTIWIILVAINLRKAKSSTEKMICTDSIYHSVSLPILCFVAPVVALPFYLIMRHKYKKHEKELMTCPICDSQLTRDETVKFKPASASQMFEVENDIKYYWMCKCDNGHSVARLQKGDKYKDYTDCPECGGHTCKVSQTVRTVEPTYSSKGEEVLTITCKHCGHTYEEKVELPKLSHSSIGGGGRSGGGGYRSSGGSRGGGRSGGGGARGRW